MKVYKFRIEWEDEHEDHYCWEYRMGYHLNNGLGGFHVRLEYVSEVDRLLTLFGHEIVLDSLKTSTLSTSPIGVLINLHEQMFNAQINL